MSKCPKCGSDVKPHKVGGFACDLTLAHRNSKAPPVSSVPGEPKPEASEGAGPYYFWLTEKFGGAHLMGPGIADFPVEVWYTPDNLVSLGNKAYREGRASMKAEMEAKDKDAAETMSFTVDLCNKAHDRAIGELKSELEAARADKVKAEEKGGELCRVLGTIMLEVPEAAAFVKKYNQEKYIAALTPSKETKP